MTDIYLAHLVFLGRLIGSYVEHLLIRYSYLDLFMLILILEMVNTYKLNIHVVMETFKLIQI